MRIGIDLGGTKIEGIVLDRNGREVLRRRVATPRDDYAGTLKAIADLVRSFESELGVSIPHIGLGAPGTLSSQTGFIKNSNSVWLIGQPLDRDLSALIEKPVRMANDANCFALSEATDGAAKGAGVVFGVILGTGVGGGIIVGGQVLNGVNGIAGEWGHNPLPWPEGSEYPGPKCYCGQRGCIETFLSGPGLAADYQRATGKSLSGEEIVKLSNSKEAEALATLKRYEHRLARGLASIINVLDPEVIVLGGGLSNISRIYENVPGLLSKHVFSDAVKTRIVKAVFGDSSGVRGAAWL